ncbi:MAG: 2-oxo acid dehydrogenase subunit E2 [Pseudomonadaceae bacterium]|nr:2-oxo acid dehydrogenase subunit E2 [Pseudomonadaceae bacterium]
MPTEIYLVKVGMNMTEGVVEEWYIPDGGTVSAGELLYRLETEKVNLDVDAERDGIVRHVVPEGETKEPGDIVGYIFDAGEDIPANLGAATPSPVASADAAPAESPSASTAASASTEASRDGDRIKASPAARRLAGELGVDYTQLAGTGPGGRIVEADVQTAADASRAVKASPQARKVARELAVDITTVTGTGPGGRITKDDVEAASKAPSQNALPALPAAPAAGAGESIPVRGMRKTIAERMHSSLMESAQLTMDMDVVMDDAIKLRAQLIDEWSDEGIRPSYNDLVIRAVSKSLRDHPMMNASFMGTEIVTHAEVAVGMAVALDEGLIVPVVRNSDRLGMRDLAVESARLAVAARDGKLGLDDLQGGTFTVSALGMFGVDSFTPIINAPQSGILGVNRIRDDVAWDGDRPVRRQVMRLSLTWDHRTLDGAPAAQFLASVRDYLESPFRLLI